MQNHYSIFASYKTVDSSKDKRFVALPHSLINHQSFTTLKPNSKLIYLYMMDYAQGNQVFSYPRRMNKNLVSAQTFKTSVGELIEHGFIKIKSYGGLENNEKKYEFCSDWKYYTPVKKKKRQTKIQENKKRADFH